jgi:hypothetical protein
MGGSANARHWLCSSVRDLKSYLKKEATVIPKED